MSRTIGVGPRMRAPAAPACRDGQRRHALAALSLLALTLLFPPPAPAAEAEPRISVGLSHQRAYEGHAVLYRVTLHNVEDDVEPKLGELDDFNVTPLGARTLESRRLEIVGKERTEVVERARQYSYRLMPLKTGTLTLPAPSVEIDGRVLKGQERRLEVLPAEAQDVVLAEIIADRFAVYPMQPFTVTLVVAVKGLPEPYASRDPLSVQTQAPALQIPWASDDELPEGLEPQIEQDHWLQTLRPDSGSGFRINNHRRHDVFSLLHPEPMSFVGRVSRIKRRDNEGKEVVYWQYVYPRRFVARWPGTYRFGPVTVRGTFATRHMERGLVGEEIYAVAGPIEVVVRDVPEEGRPESFTGAIGRFELQAELAPRRARIGDPMTFTLTLRGEGTLETTRAPELHKIRKIRDHFDVYDTTQETDRDACRFTYSLRPKRPGTMSFPAVEMAYFDIDAEEYATLRTEPIPIEVIKADRLSSEQIVSAPGPGVQGELEAHHQGIFANITDPSSVRDESVRPGRWFLGLAGLAGLYAVAALAVVRLRRLAGDRPLVRRRRAAGRARRRFREALAALRAGQLRQGTDRLQDALIGLVADVADLPEAGLTSRDVAAPLRSLGVSDELVGRVVRLLDACDAARYGALEEDPAALAQQAEAVLKELVRTLKTKKRLR